MTGTLRYKPLVGIPGYDEFLVIGDSNTSAGLAIDGSIGYDPAIDITDPVCFERKQNGVTVVAQDPLDYPTGVVAGGISFAIPFMRDGYKSRLIGGRTGVRVTAAGQKGSSVYSGFWQPGGAGLLAAKSRFSAALAESTGNHAKGILWVGGANDAAGAVSQVDFTTYMTAMLTDLWATYGAIPTLLSGFPHALVVSDAAHFKPIDDTLRALPATYSNVAYVNTDTLLAYPSGVHFTNVSHRAMGPLFNTAFGTL